MGNRFHNTRMQEGTFRRLVTDEALQVNYAFGKEEREVTKFCLVVVGAVASILRMGHVIVRYASRSAGRHFTLLRVEEVVA